MGAHKIRVPAKPSEQPTAGDISPHRVPEFAASLTDSLNGPTRYAHGFRLGPRRR
jgi:hypothetical protein